MQSPELSIIIPTLNEAEALPLLFDDLVAQTDIAIEVIVSDGGSDDKTCQLVDDFFNNGRLQGELLRGERGRGFQLNAGARASTSDWLLFLHADSRLPDKHQLHNALEYIQSVNYASSDNKVAGRFPLRFSLQNEEYCFGYYFYEAKAELGRSGCIHGDQGMLMLKSYFLEIGPFRDDLPVMEDTCLAESIRNNGQWFLLPGEIITSARRFQTEGLRARQTLNALMMNFLSIGWLDFFQRAPEVYNQQDKSKALKLQPFFQLIRSLLKQMPMNRRFDVWLETGRYVKGQAWQIGWFFDCRKAFRQGGHRPVQPGPWLKWFDGWFEPLTNHLLGDLLTAVLVRAWFSFRLWRG